MSMTQKLSKDGATIKKDRTELLRDVHDAVHCTSFPLTCPNCRTGYETLLDLCVGTKPQPQLVLYKELSKPHEVNIVWLFPQVCPCGGLVNVTLTDNMHPTLIRKFAEHITEYAQTHGERPADVYHMFKEQLLEHHATHGQFSLIANAEAKEATKATETYSPRKKH